MAPKSRTPSSPRLILPLFSVRHSPRLTKRNGVPPRNAPARIARGTANHPIPALRLLIDQCLCILFSEHLPFAVETFAVENNQEHDSLKYHDGGIRQMMVALQNASTGQQSSKQDRNEDATEGALARQKCDQDATVAIPGIERLIGPSVNGGHLDHACEPRAGPRQETGDQSDSSDRNSRNLCRSDISADRANLESQRRLTDQNPCEKTSNQAEHQPPMDGGVAKRLQHPLI